MKKPMIGVTPLYDEGRESYWMLPGYMKGIEEAGGIPVMLPLNSEPDVINSFAAAFDGFLFTGGPDVSPEIYGEKPEAFCGKPCVERDCMEELLFRRVLQLDKPALGICRGLQLFNALLGGALYQDIPSQLSTDTQISHSQKPPYDKPVHTVTIERGSPLYKLLEVDSMAVNSYHHQGIKRLSSQLKAAAEADDGMIEAVYMPGKKFVWAVQWHPEFIYKADDRNLQLFKEFVRACGE